MPQYQDPFTVGQRAVAHGREIRGDPCRATGERESRAGVGENEEAVVGMRCRLTKNLKMTKMPEYRDPFTGGSNLPRVFIYAVSPKIPFFLRVRACASCIYHRASSQIQT